MSLFLRVDLLRLVFLPCDLFGDLLERLRLRVLVLDLVFLRRRERVDELLDEEWHVILLTRDTERPRFLVPSVTIPGSKCAHLDPCLFPLVSLHALQQ